MIELLKQEISRHGHKFRIIPVERLNDLKNDIENFAKEEDLNNFQRFIVDNIYDYKVLATNFEAKSVLIMAIPIPAYAKVEFSWGGKKYFLKSLATAYMGGEDAFTVTRDYLEKLVDSKGYHIESAPNLPLKRLAASSGLAAYGRNNITYIDGIGSFYNLVAYFTDIQCVEDSWTGVRKSDNCANCNACIKNCPTGAIRKDRFLIDNERCLSFFNEGPGEFPQWMPLSVHHCIYDCLKCQSVCPMNKACLNNVIGPVEFNEEETGMLLEGKELTEFNEVLKKKVRLLGMDKWLKAIPRNIKILFELSDNAS